MNRYLPVEPTRTQKETSAYTAMLLISRHGDENFSLLDALSDRTNLVDRPRHLIGMSV
ncbi:hypothetical protein [Paraburkholderia phenoliruptrix]|uniref:hypothetical protein n=1 Tax=Paraburkholderia phenoliruptrix TaxID=252970 RepID=UPI0034CE05EC